MVIYRTSLNCIFASGQLKEGEMYDVDFYHQFIETEKYDAKPTYKKFLGYRPDVAVIGDLIVGIENYYCPLNIEILIPTH